MVDYSIQAIEALKNEGTKASLYNMRFAKPLDEEALDSIAKKYNKIVTIEENAVVGGFGTGVIEYFNQKNYKNDVLRIGLPDEFIDHGTQAELHNLLKIDSEGIVTRVQEFVKK